MKDRGKLIEQFTESSLRSGLTEFNVGDTIKVYVKVKEEVKGKDGKGKSRKTRERLQAFEGICIGRKGGGIEETFKVRKVASGGIGVERTFPIHSPIIDRIEVVRQGKVPSPVFYSPGKISVAGGNKCLCCRCNGQLPCNGK